MGTVTAAQKLDKAHIVTYDWLEDSLYKKRRLSEKKYLWEKVDKERKKKKQMRRVADKHDRKTVILLISRVHTNASRCRHEIRQGLC
jgi:hypothetical protein